MKKLHTPVALADLLLPKGSTKYKLHYNKWLQEHGHGARAQEDIARVRHKLVLRAQRARKWFCCLVSECLGKAAEQASAEHLKLLQYVRDYYS